jgi:hypothetical protein
VEYPAASLYPRSGGQVFAKRGHDSAFFGLCTGGECPARYGHVPAAERNENSLKAIHIGIREFIIKSGMFMVIMSF